MTPPATAAARSANRSAAGSRRAAVRHPRRISGPTVSARSAAVAIPAPGIALPRRRAPRPLVDPRRRRAHRTRHRSTRGAPGIALRAIGAFEGIAGSALLDRLIRGRVWIGLLAFSLIGIVAMQLVVLQLNTGIGRTLGRVATLQRENAQLGIEDSMYSAESRVAPLAAAAGMTLAPAGAVHFVAASPAEVSRAAAVLSTAIQAPAGALSGSSETASATSQATGTETGEASSGAAQSTAATSETTGSAERGGSSGREGTGGSSEASSATSSGTGSSASSSSPSTAGTPATPSSGEGGQATGASSAPQGASASAGVGAGAPGGGTQAAPRE